MIAKFIACVSILNSSNSYYIIIIKIYLFPFLLTDLSSQLGLVEGFSESQGVFFPPIWTLKYAPCRQLDYLRKIVKDDMTKLDEHVWHSYQQFCKLVRWRALGIGRCASFFKCYCEHQARQKVNLQAIHQIPHIFKLTIKEDIKRSIYQTVKQIEYQK